jgi:hypothetical protein
MTNDFMYQSPRNLSIYAIVGFALMIVSDVISVLIGFGQIAMPDWNMELEGTASVWLLLQGVFYLLKFPLYIFTVVMFLVWVNRANKNLTPLKADMIEFSSGWAVGWWFIPFANLVKPFQVVRELWCESDPDDVEAPGFLSASMRSAPTFMGVWWAMWLISNFLSNITSRIYDPDSIANIALVGFFFIATGITSAIAAYLAIMVVRGITARQDDRMLKVGSLHRDMSPPPPPTFGQQY